MQALYENLPVYKAALDLFKYFDQVVRRFDRYHKYTLGKKLRDLSVEILAAVSRANTKTNRVECLQNAIDLLGELRIMVHACNEVKAFNNMQSAGHATRLIVSISKQCEGWLRKSLNPSNGSA